MKHTKCSELKFEIESSNCLIEKKRTFISLIECPNVCYYAEVHTVERTELLVKKNAFWHKENWLRFCCLLCEWKTLTTIWNQLESPDKRKLI